MRYSGSCEHRVDRRYRGPVQRAPCEEHTPLLRDRAIESKNPVFETLPESVEKSLIAFKLFRDWEQTDTTLDFAERQRAQEESVFFGVRDPPQHTWAGVGFAGL